MRSASDAHEAHRRVIRAIQRLSNLLKCGWLATRNRFSSQTVLGECDVDVALTTFGRRTAKVFLALESIGRGTARPRSLTLWLDDSYRGASLPHSIRRLQRRGLSVRFCHDWKSYKKFYPHVQSHESFVRPLATADDDVVYPPTWLHGLWAARARVEAPTMISYRAHVMALDSNAFTPYRTWAPCQTTTPSVAHFSTGVSGALLPVELLSALKSGGTGFLTTCPNADDVWLHFHALKQGIPVAQVSAASQLFTQIPRSQRVSLMSSNVLRDENDSQIVDTYSLREIVAVREAVANASGRREPS